MPSTCLALALFRTLVAAYFTSVQKFRIGSGFKNVLCHLYDISLLDPIEYFADVSFIQTACQLYPVYRGVRMQITIDSFIEQEELLFFISLEKSPLNKQLLYIISSIREHSASICTANRGRCRSLSLDSCVGNRAYYVCHSFVSASADCLFNFCITTTSLFLYIYYML